VGDVYVTPGDLPPMTMALRGAIVGCALDTAFSIGDVTSKLAAKNVTGVVPTSGTTTYRIAYRTYRDDGVPGVSTARVYLPGTPRTAPLPVVAIAHPTEGLAPSCAPSMDPTDQDDLALPWAAHGFAVVATDYAGLGNAGVQGYTDNHDQAHSLLDSVRALRALLDPSVLDQRVLLVGYSQGGGAVLASQGLAGSYGVAGNVVAAVVFAAEYYARNDSFDYATMLAEPDALTISTGISMPVVVAMRDYAFGYNVLGPSSAAATFPAGAQAGLASAIMSQCQAPFGAYLQGTALHVGDLWDDGFRRSLLACTGNSTAADADGGDATCSGIAAQFYTWMQNDLVAPDPAGAPVLYVQGLDDSIMPPAEEAACNIGELTAAGVDVQVCVDPPAEHTTVVPRNVAFALGWSEAKLYGGTLPACSSAGMPACQP
jgi:pimeloyl-ACP methyl ester carboxylesterase